MNTTSRPRPWRTRRRLLLTGTVIAVFAATAAAIAVTLASSGIREDVVAAGITALVLTGVGTLVLDRRPGQTIARLCLGVGLAIAVGLTLQAIALSLDHVRPRNSVLVGFATLGSSMLAGFAMIVGGPLLLARFPDGGSGSRRQRLVDLAVLVGIASVLLNAVSRPDLQPGWIADAPNPIWIDLPGWLNNVTSVGGIVVLVIAYALVVAELFGRYQVGDRVIRAQIRWVAAATAVNGSFIGLVVVSALVNYDAPWAWSAWILSTTLPPIAIGLAVTRYRLYDIDRIISRTIAYLVVTGILAALFLAANLLVQSVANRLTGAGGLAVAISTLLVAAAFTPIRRRVQVVVDRRFHRAGYDAERTVEGLRRRLRDEVEPEAIRAALSEAIARSVQPSAAGVWLRAQGDATR